ncbi:MAG: LysM peptidoglycan-binding domain-containing protein, partial [Nannocystaceae bacterium]
MRLRSSRAPWLLVASMMGALASPAASASVEAIERPATAGVAALAAPSTHVVKAGETLSKIGNRYGCAVHRLQEINKIEDPKKVRVGQRLKIPACQRSSRSVHVVKAGETLTKIASKYSCGVKSLQRANKIDNPSKIRVGQRLRLPASCDAAEAAAPERAKAEADDPRTLGKGWYRVQAGDTLSALSVVSGCSVQVIQRANKMEGTSLREGQRLRIPDCGQPSSASSSARVTSSDDLEALMRAEGFSPPKKFKALVTVIDFDGQRKVKARRRYGYGKTADDVYGWNPASTVKIYAAVAALLRIEKKGFTRKASVRFYGRKGKYETTVEELVEASLIKSDNIAHNRLVQLAGFDNLNQTFFSARNGFKKSAISSAYETKKWIPMGEKASFRETPKIVLRERGKRRTIPAAVGEAKPHCAGGACTSLLDLSEGVARIMLDQLPASKRYALSKST